jgi:hypothetical protein
MWIMKEGDVIGIQGDPSPAYESLRCAPCLCSRSA